MTRPAALTASLGIVAALLLAIIQTFADPFGLKDWWKTVAAETNPYKDPAFLYDRAEASYRSGDYAIAGDLSRRVLTVNPDNKAAYKLLTAIHLKNKDYRKAEETARAAARIDPGDADAQLAVGESLRGQGMTEEAVRAYQAVVENKIGDTRQREAAVEKLSELKSAESTPTEPTTPSAPTVEKATP